jgi:hypothetical protein
LDRFALTKKTYVVVDLAANGAEVVETFLAPHDIAAVRRAQFAATGVAVELWRDTELVGRWVRSGRRSFAVAA